MRRQMSGSGFSALRLRCARDRSRVAFEREDVNFAGIGLQFSPSVQFTEAVVPPQFERKPDWWIYERLASAMASAAAVPAADPAS